MKNRRLHGNQSQTRTEKEMAAQKKKNHSLDSTQQHAATQLKAILSYPNQTLTSSSIAIAQRAIGNQATLQLLESYSQLNPTSQHIQVPMSPGAQSTQLQSEEHIQRKTDPMQRVELDEEELLQPKTIQRKENQTGLPDQLKAGVESLSGMDLSDVQVQYNSDKPAQLNALAYAQGNQIHVAQGQEKHLAHEAWHVVQQRQGRVKPTMQFKEGVPINDDRGLEQEADRMGAEALKLGEEMDR
ncbi:DUF4157 domain-containing protein [Bacillus horti]|uniref:eCIS core domain-containing protein n=1 Tax=Caldalkalibacillus horti TaxID=77523 RepID=A0ABT9VZX5_9BACI|nr:DUF4157 domain-containing protein [Bacillus horti]MDQ0166553.1 hypothetical protein [Bacillus horti]